MVVRAIVGVYDAMEANRRCWAIDIGTEDAFSNAKSNRTTGGNSGDGGVNGASNGNGGRLTRMQGLAAPRTSSRDGTARTPPVSRLRVRAPNDRLQQEADQVAARVMRMPAPPLEAAAAGSCR